MNREQGWDTRPNVIPWPPILLVLAATSAYGLGLLIPLPIGGGSAIHALGYFVLAAGIGLDLSAIVWMRRARTNILPHRGADSLVVDGPFRFTRNPIYLGNAILMVGLALLSANGWFLLSGAAMAFLVDRLAVHREERHLNQRFGERWQRYAARTPRWLLR